MKNHLLAITIEALGLVLGSIAFLINMPQLAFLGLMLGAIAFGMLLVTERG